MLTALISAVHSWMAWAILTGVVGLVAFIAIGYTIYRGVFCSDTYDYDKFIRLRRWSVVLAVILIGCIIGLIVTNVHAAAPPPEEPEPAAAEVEEEGSYLDPVEFNQAGLREQFGYISHNFDPRSLPNFADYRMESIKKAYNGVTFSDAVSDCWITEAEVKDFRALSDGPERDDQMKEWKKLNYKVAVESFVPAYALLECMATDEYFYKNNPKLREDYEEIKWQLEHGDGWAHYLLKSPEYTEDNQTFIIENDIWYTFTWVCQIAEFAVSRGIEQLPSTSNWYLPVGQQRWEVHAVRQDNPEHQDKMYWFILDFMSKDSIAADGGSAIQRTIGINTADRRPGRFDATAKEETPKPADKPKDNGKKPDPKPKPQDPEPDPPPVIVVEPDPAPAATYTVTERFVDMDGKQIDPDNPQGTRLEAGKTWRASYNDKLADKGYVLVKTTTNAGDIWTGRNAFAVSGKMPAQNLVVTFHYELKPLLVIRYKDAQTKKEFTDLRVEERIAEGEYYEKDSPTAAELRRLGYGDYKAPDRAIVEGTMGNRDVEEIVWYTPKYTTITIHFRDIANEDPVARDKELTEKTGTSRTYYPGDIKGYTLVTKSQWIVFEYGNEYTIYYRQKTVVPPDGQGGKDLVEDPANKGNADKNGGDRQHGDNNSNEQNSDPGHTGGTVVGTDGNVTENRGDGSGQSGAGNQSTTNHDSTGTGSKTDPTVTVPDTGHTNGGTPSANNPINQTTGDAATGSTANNTGGNTNITQGTNNTILGNGTVLDTD